MGVQTLYRPKELDGKAITKNPIALLGFCRNLPYLPISSFSLIPKGSKLKSQTTQRKGKTEGKENQTEMKLAKEKTMESERKGLLKTTRFVLCIM